jgi:hypothetical protein
MRVSRFLGPSQTMGGVLYLGMLLQGDRGSKSEVGRWAGGLETIVGWLPVLVRSDVADWWGTRTSPKVLLAMRAAFPTGRSQG